MGLKELAILREEQNTLIQKIWSTEGKVKVKRTFIKGGKEITQSMWVTPKEAKEMGLKPIEEIVFEKALPGAEGLAKLKKLGIKYRVLGATK
jgi:hypothetical protein